MKKEKINRKRACARILTTAIILLTIGLVINNIPIAKADWIPTTTLSRSPYTIYINEGTTFEYVLYNGQNKGLDVTKVWVHFSWQQEGFGYNLISSKVTIPAYESHTFTLTVVIPQISTGIYTQNVDVTGQAVGDWWSTTGHWDFSQQVDIRPPLEVDITGNPNSGNTPLKVYFTSTVDGGKMPYSYSWTFGDGTTSTYSNPSHTYSSTGTYTAKLIVTDNLLKTQSDTTTIMVSSPPQTNGNGNGDNDDDGETTTAFNLWYIIIPIVVVAIVVIIIVVLISIKKPKMK